ncbi:MAG: 8-oxoguanine DNA glycosylase [Clostridia bacterium]|nr:8-oxoguanine DNA glycosylase [Clostridia bacterium]
MDYKGYKVTEEKDRLIVEGTRDFNPVHIFECGQCFRWMKEADGSYTGVARDKVVNVSFDGGTLIINNSSLQDFTDIWYDYFDLERDYSAVKECLGKDDIMREAIKFGYGIRLLRQDIWETLISFIISANNMIPRIMRTVSAIAKVYGNELVYNGKSYFSFPDVKALSGSSVEDLEFCKGGFRCKYIVNTSRMVMNGEVNLTELKDMTADAGRSELTRFPGVGNKVADCTLLFSGTRYDVFPTDVWVKRVMEELYFKREASFREIQAFAADYFGGLSGFAQQYLFYYARENKIGVK